MGEKGLVIVYTGSGKGKTTAALGLAMRAVGQGMKVVMIQFIKGTWKYGEMETAKRLAPDFELLPMGKGFTWEEKEPGADERAAAQALARARDIVRSGQYQVVILDEINNALDYGFIPLEEVLSLIQEKPEGLHLVLTGRNARPEVMEFADLVTEMKEVKHPFKKGVLAMRGVDF